MHILDLLQNRNGKVLISIEILPPDKGDNWNTIRDTILKLKPYGIEWTSVTSHAHRRSLEIVNGHPIVRIRKKKLDTNAMCIAVKLELGIEVMPHLIASGFSKDETEDALLNLHFFGVKNVLALRGDLIPSTLPFQIHHLQNTYSSDLIEQIINMNNGIYLDKLEITTKTDFCIGVAGYPEKHYESPDLKTDLKYVKHKIEKGAHFIITQMFFDNDFFYRFRENLSKIGIKVPIIPGIKPIYATRHITKLPKIFHISVPKKLARILEKYSSEDDIEKAGIEYTASQCLDLIENEVPSVHFYTMNNAEPVSKILEAINAKTETRRFEAVPACHLPADRQGLGTSRKP